MENASFSAAARRTTGSRLKLVVLRCTSKELIAGDEKVWKYRSSASSRADRVLLYSRSTAFSEALASCE